MIITLPYISYNRIKISLNFRIIKRHLTSFNYLPSLLNYSVSRTTLLPINKSPLFFIRNTGHARKILRSIENKKVNTHLGSTQEKKDVVAAPNSSNQDVTPVNVDNTTKTSDKSLLDKFFGNISFINKDLIKKKLNHSPNSDNNSSHVIRNKEAIIEQLRFFYSLPEDQVSDLKLYLDFVQKLAIEKPNYVFSRQGQVTMEVLNNRKRFDENLLRETFPEFQLIDLLGKNNNVTDVTTMFNMLVGDTLVKNFPYVRYADPKVVNSTILPMFNPDKVPEKLQKFILYSKMMTGNSIADLTLCNVPFDYKATPSTNNNFIVLWDYEQFTIYNDVLRYNTALLRTLEKLSRTKFQDILFQNLKTVMLDNSIDLITKQHIINEIIIKNIKYMTIHDKTSLIFPIDNKPFIPNTEITKDLDPIVIPFKRSAIDHGVTKKAIMGVVETWPSSKQKTFHEATQNSFETKDKEEID